MTEMYSLLDTSIRWRNTFISTETQAKGRFSSTVLAKQSPRTGTLRGLHERQVVFLPFYWRAWSDNSKKENVIVPTTKAAKKSWPFCLICWVKYACLPTVLSSTPPFRAVSGYPKSSSLYFSSIFDPFDLSACQFQLQMMRGHFWNRELWAE